MTAVKFIGGFGNYARGGDFKDCDVGIEAIDTDIELSDHSFDNVAHPYRILRSKARIRSSRIRNDPKLKYKIEIFDEAGTGAKVPGLPVQCPKCESIFSSKNYTIESSIIDIFDAEEECCRCTYEHARVSNGLFRITSDVIEVLHGSDLTYAVVASLIDSSRASIEGRISSKELQRRFAKADPRLGLLAKFAANKGKSAICFLAFIVPIVVTVLYGQLQLEEARLANEFARKSYEAQSQPNQTEFLLKEVLKEISVYRIQAVQKPGDTKDGPTCQPRDDPAGAKSPAETGSFNLPAKSKPKFRHMKRRSQAKRRHAFNPRHKQHSLCD